MSQPDDILKRSELLNRLVLDRQTAEKVGHVSQLLLDNHAQKVVGIVCKSGLLGKQKYILSWEQIEAIGKDSVLVNLPKNHELEIADSIEPPINREVWTNTGNKAGKLLEFFFDLKTGSVVSYLFSASGLQGILDGVYLLPPSAISSVGTQRVIVLEIAVQNPQKYTEGLGRKIDQATVFLHQDYHKTKSDLEVMKQKTQGMVGQVKDAAQGVTEKIKPLAAELQNSDEKSDLPKTDSSEHQT
ncbi:MAG: PRC-barrel domain-containing protein [Microcoleaceae cyanobacterium]